MDDITSKDDKSDMNGIQSQKTRYLPGKVSVGMLILLIIMNTTVSALTVYIYDRYFARETAFIDIRGYMLDRKNLFLAGTISEKQFIESVDNIEKALQRTSKRTVVLLGDAVVRNAEKIDIDR